MSMIKCKYCSRWTEEGSNADLLYGAITCEHCSMSNPGNVNVFELLVNIVLDLEERVEYLEKTWTEDG